jgi:hypothetical protein
MPGRASNLLCLLAIRLNKIQALTSFKVAIATKNAPFEFERNLIGTGAKEIYY